VRQYWDLVEPGWDVVWIARPALDAARFEQLQVACASLLSQARILRAEAS
jgi:RNase P protein component